MSCLYIEKHAPDPLRVIITSRTTSCAGVYMQEAYEASAVKNSCSTACTVQPGTPHLSAFTSLTSSVASRSLIPLIQFFFPVVDGKIHILLFLLAFSRCTPGMMTIVNKHDLLAYTYTQSTRRQFSVVWEKERSISCKCKSILSRLMRGRGICS